MILYCLCALVVIVPLISNFVPSQGIAVVKLFSVALLFMWLMRAARGGRTAVKFNALGIWFCVFLGAAILSVIVSPYKLNGTRRLLDIISFAVIYIVTVNAISSKDDLKKLVTALFVSLALVCLYGIGQFLNMANVIWRAQPWGSTYGNRIFSTIGNPNWLASFIISIFPFALSMLFISMPKNKTYKYLLSAVAIVSFAALVLTNSWAGWGGFVFSIGIMAYLLGRFKKIKALQLKGDRGFIILIAIMVIIFTIFAFSKGADIFGDPGHFKERVIRYFAAIKMIAGHPFSGIGLGNLPVYADYYVKDFINMPYFSILWDKEQSQLPTMRDRAENEFLDIGAETGLLGLGAFLLFLFFFFRHAIRRLKDEGESGAERQPPRMGKRSLLEEDNFNAALLIGSIGSVSAILFDSLFGFPLHVVPSTLTFITALALIRDGSAANRESVPKGDRFRFSSRTVPALVLGVAAFFIIKGFVADIYLAKAVIAKNRENYNAALYNVAQVKKYSNTLVEVSLEEGVAHRVLGNYAEAIEPLKQYLKERPYHVLAHYNLGYCYLKLGDIDSAIKEYKEAVFLKPRFAFLYESVALAYIKKGDLEKAKELFTSALQFNPNSVLAFLELDVLNTSGGGQVPDWHQNRPYSDYSGKGTEYLQKGELDLAIAAYKKGPDDASTLSNLGVAYHAKGMLIQAILSWRKALMAEPDNEVVIKNLGAISVPVSLLAGINLERPLVDVPILMYHRVVDNPTNEYEVATSEFEKQMKALKDNGFTALTLFELFDCRDGKRNYPKKPIVITFDDVYEDFYENAYPILKSNGLKADCFLIADYVGKENEWGRSLRLPKATHLGWDKIKELSRSGLVSFNSHSATHKSLTGLKPSQRNDELIGSKKAIEDALGKEVQFLSYPFGRFDPEAEMAVRAAGYRGAVSASGGIEEANYANPFELRRVLIKGGTPAGEADGQGADSLSDFLRKI